MGCKLRLVARAAFTLKASMNVIFGINAVAESLKARGRAFEWGAVATERKDLRLQKLIQDCRKSRIPVRFLPRVDLDRIAASGSHPGLAPLPSNKPANA